MSDAPDLISVTPVLDGWTGPLEWGVKPGEYAHDYIRADLVHADAELAKQHHAEVFGAGVDLSPQWQPIDTAPKDGTVVDLWCKRSWNPPTSHVRETGKYYCTTHNLWRTEGETHYVEATFAPDACHRHLIPTHWVPLPASPTE